MLCLLVLLEPQIPRSPARPAPLRPGPIMAVANLCRPSGNRHAGHTLRVFKCWLEPARLGIISAVSTTNLFANFRHLRAQASGFLLPSPALASHSSSQSIHQSGGRANFLPVGLALEVPSLKSTLKTRTYLLVVEQRILMSHARHDVPEDPGSYRDQDPNIAGAKWSRQNQPHKRLVVRPYEKYRLPNNNWNDTRRKPIGLPAAT